MVPAVIGLIIVNANFSAKIAEAVKAVAATGQNNEPAFATAIAA